MRVILDDEAQIGTIDKSNMRGILEGFPELCEDSIRLCRAFTIPRSVKIGDRIEVEYSCPENVIITGMGGSAIGGNLLRDWIRDRFSGPIEISREYTLPKYAGRKTVVIAASYSGNTEETLSSFIQAVEKGCMTISISSGGLLEEFSRTLRLPHMKIPSGYTPRCALPYLFFHMAFILQRLGVLDSFDDESAATVETLKGTRELIRITTPTDRNPSKKLALELHGLIPMVCGFGAFESVATRIKTQFNENSKTPAKAEFFPELNHNETLGWCGSRGLTKHLGVILVRSGDEPPEVRARMEITKDLVFNQRAGRVLEIRATGSQMLSQMFSSMYVGDFASFYLGVLYGIDPTPVPIIDELKKKLEARLNKTADLKSRVQKLQAA